MTMFKVKNGYLRKNLKIRTGGSKNPGIISEETSTVLGIYRVRLFPVCQGLKIGITRQPLRRLWLEKVLPQHPLLHGPCIRSMPTGFPFTGRKKTGSSMGLRSAGPLLPTGLSTVRRTIFSRCMITSIGSC